MNKNKYHAKDYVGNFYEGFTGLIFKKCHSLLEKYNFNSKINNVLEIGGGYHPHISYIKHEYNNYYCVELNNNSNLHNFYKKKYPNIILRLYNGKKLKFKNNFFDRIIISHCLEHILEPEKFINEMLRVLKYGKILSIALPCDPGLLWRLSREIKKINYKSVSKTKNYDYVMATEHVNSIFNLKAIIEHKFKVVKEIFYPLNFKIVDCNLFYIVHIKK